MDIHHARTFLEVVAAGSFAAAAERLYITQSAVSIRIQKLEGELTRKLFTRSKSGVVLTPYGQEFEPHARSLIQVWEEARYKIAIPEEYDASLAIGSQYSLWPELALNWLELMEQKMPTVAFNVHLGLPDRLTRLLMTGLVDMAVVYTPELRPGLRADHLMDDRLVHVTGDPNHPGGIDDRYVYMNWGPEFAATHTRWYPDFRLSRTSLLVGAAAVPYLIRNKKSAYMPYRVADDHVAAGNLHFVPDAPEMPFAAYVVWTNTKDDELITQALALLRIAAKNAPMLDLSQKKPKRKRK